MSSENKNDSSKKCAPNRRDARLPRSYRRVSCQALLAVSCCGPLGSASHDCA